MIFKIILNVYYLCSSNFGIISCLKTKVSIVSRHIATKVKFVIDSYYLILGLYTLIQACKFKKVKYFSTSSCNVDGFTIKSVT